MPLRGDPVPTYDYECSACPNRFEAMQGIKDEPLKVCPACNQESLKRLIGSGSGIVFKGTGFYCTDYPKAKAPPKESA
jgi:putative FmdB family regulatory protein